MKASTPTLEALAAVRRPETAAVLLHPLRLRVLCEARHPTSASEIAARLELPRQRVNHHVRALAKAGFLRRAGRRKKRNMIEQLYETTARAWVLSPELLGAAAPDATAPGDAFSSATLAAHASRLLGELTRSREQAAKAGKALATLSVGAALRFESAAQRRAFTEELEQAVLSVVARHSSPFAKHGDRPGRGRPFRLLLGCWPLSPEDERAELDSAATRREEAREETT